MNRLKTKKKIVVAGGGVSGLICAHVFKKYLDVDVSVLEPYTLGDEFLVGGLKYIHRTDKMEKLFDELGLPHSHYRVRGGIMLRGKIFSHPQVFKTLGREQSLRIQSDHYRKTRRSEPGADVRKAMNDPAGISTRRALRANFRHMVKGLAEGVKVEPAGIRTIIHEANCVLTSLGKLQKYDYLVLTTPLWAIRECANFYVPHGVAMKLNVVDVIGPRHDKYVRWDYVYTPYTPADSIHRFTPNSDGYSVEVNGDFDFLSLVSDLNFIFPGGYHIANVRRGLKGHLFPLKEKIAWPENIAPLGRFAQWESSSTVDTVLEDATALASRWFG